jgi:hypothetical protein
MYDVIAIDIAFELGQLFDKSGDTTQAFQYFAEGNRLAQQYPAHQEINPAEFTDLVDGVNARLSVDWLATWKDISPPAKGRTPAFIIGFPRSRTTLIEQILSAHPLLQTLDEKPTLDTPCWCNCRAIPTLWRPLTTRRRKRYVRFIMTRPTNSSIPVAPPGP